MDQVVFTILTTCVMLGKFGDFLLSQAPAPEAQEGEATPDAAAKGKAVAKSGTTAQGPPPRYAQRLLVYTLEFLEDLFGNSVISGKRIYRIFLISAFYVQGSVLFSSLITPKFWAATQASAPLLTEFRLFLSIAVAVLMLVLANLVADLISVDFCIRCLKYLKARLPGCPRAGSQKHPYLALTLGTAVVLLFYYLLFISTANLYFSLIINLQGIAAGYGELGAFFPSLDMQSHILWNESLIRLFDPIAEGRYMGINGVNVLIFCVTPLFAPVFVLLAVGVGALMEAADGLTGRRVEKWIKERRSTQPYFVKAASVLALIGAAASTLLEAGDG